MCKLLAIKWGDTVSPDDKITATKTALALYTASERDGFGIVNEKLDRIRNPELSHGLLNSTKFNDMVGGSKLLIGHARTATRGKVKSANCQPFSNGRTAFIHNGTLDDYGELSGNMSDSREFYKKNCRNTNDFLSGIDDLYGWFAFMFYNKRSEKLYVVKQQADLSINITRDGNTIVATRESDAEVIARSIGDEVNSEIVLDRNQVLSTKVDSNGWYQVKEIKEAIEPYYMRTKPSYFDQFDNEFNSQYHVEDNIEWYEKQKNLQDGSV